MCSDWYRHIYEATTQELIEMIKSKDYAAAREAGLQLARRGNVAVLRELEADTSLHQIARSMARGALRHHIDKDGNWKD